MTVYVCPIKDIVCGDREENWCAECPKLNVGRYQLRDCPACRGIRLEKQWCPVCNCTGLIVVGTKK